MRAELAAVLGGSTAAAGLEPAAPELLYTPFGGLLLLLPRVGELPVDELWRDEDDRARARLAILSRAAGAERLTRVLEDPLVQRLCGLRHGARDLDDWLVAHQATIADALPTALARHRWRDASTVCLAIARHRDWGPLQVAIAEPEGYWLALAPLDASLRAGLRAPASLAVDGRSIVAEPSLARAHAAGRVLDHVTPPSSPLTAAAERGLALAAQHLLRAFARRLPGFADSSPRHLWANFLDFDASVVESGRRFRCRVGRPPLAALLGMTGALRGQVQLGFGERAVLELATRG